MTVKRTRCIFPDDFENQTLNLANQLSALCSIPLIECLYDDGRSIKQMQNLKSIFDILIAAEQFTDALQLFILLYTSNSVSVCELALYPALSQNHFFNYSRLD